MKKYLVIFLILSILLIGCISPTPDIPIDPDIPSIPNLPVEPIDDKNLFAETDNYVVYINLDGFAKYYFDAAVENGGVKNLISLIDEGIYFEKLYNHAPSITNPNQAMIISGGSSSVTENVYRYYNKLTKTVVQQTRENKAITIYDKAVDLGISVASVKHFPAETVLSINNLNRLYVKEPTGSVADNGVRFDQAIKLVKGEYFTSGSSKMILTDVPRLLTIYCDDLDALGHNEQDNYEYKRASTEAGRIQNVLNCLEEIDKKIGELIGAYKERGIYEKTTFYLTTDHGMTPFGADSLIDISTNKYLKTKWPELRDKLKEISSTYVFEYVGAGKSPSSKTTVVGVCAGLDMQLSFVGVTMTDSKVKKLKEELLKEYYIAEVYTKAELAEQGYWSGANVDLLIVPAEKYHFHGMSNPNNSYYARGQHDSRLESSSNVFGMIWGYRVKKVGRSQDIAYSPSFGIAIADALGFTLPNANSKRLDIYEKR